MTKQGWESRKSRVQGDNSGAWASFSQDFIHLADILFSQSLGYARNRDGNCSIYTLAGIPVLFSAMRCLLIELNDGMYSGLVPRTSVLADLANSSNDIVVLTKHYRLSDELRKQLELLGEVRNEIVHPAHRPGIEKDGTPIHLHPLREAGILQSTGSGTDYLWLDQLQSHKLFRWAFETIANTVDVLLVAHNVPQFVADGLRESYTHFARCDAA